MISVCIPTYNGEKFIIDQIFSILAQLSSDDEIIVSDDGSSDKTIELLLELNDNRIVILQEKPLGSPIFNLERALNRASGDIIFLSDQDDIWLPGKVNSLKNALYDSYLILTNAFVVDEKLNKIGFFHKKGNPLGIIRNILFNNYIGATMAFRKELLIRALPFPKNIPMHDQWLGLIGELFYKNTYISEPLILYRRHTSNLSYSRGGSKNSLIKKLSFRINITMALIFRIFSFNG